MAIVKVTADLDILDKNESRCERNNSKSQFDKEYTYETMTTELFNSIIDDIKNSLKVDEKFGSESPKTKESDILDSTLLENKKIINSLNINFKPIAEDTRKIVIVSGSSVHDISFIQQLNDVRLFTHHSKFNQVFFVEKGFNDLTLLQIKYLDFMTQIAKCIDNNDIQLNGLKEYFAIEDIKLEGKLMSKFSFIFENVRWEVNNYIPNTKYN